MATTQTKKTPKAPPARMGATVSGVGIPKATKILSISNPKAKGGKR